MTTWPRIDYYEPAVNAALRILLQPGMTMFDVGANEGILSIIGGRCVGPSGRVIAFEASPRIMERLYRNLSDNHSVNVQVVNTYASNENGVAPVFYNSDSAVADSLIGTAGKTASDHVKTTRLDGFIAQTGIAPDLIKIDVEGAEPMVLQGLEGFLAQGHRPLLLLESWGDQVSCDLLHGLGYKAYDLHAMRPMNREDAARTMANL